jgi:hypothetical protein
MLKKTLLTTTILVAGASVAFAAQDRIRPIVKPRPQPTPTGMIVIRGKDDFSPVRVILSRAGSQQDQKESKEPIFTPGAAINNFSTAKNAKYLSWYGWSLVDGFSSYSGYYHVSSCPSSSYYCKFGKIVRTYNDPLAIPFKGDGLVHHKAYAAVQQGYTYSDTNPAKDNIGVDSDIGGVPGLQLAGATLNVGPSTPYCCANIKSVALGKKGTLLTSGTQYWLEVDPVPNSCTGTYGYCWADSVWDVQDSNYTSAATPSVLAYEYNSKGTTGGNPFSYSSGWFTESGGSTFNLGIELPAGEVL